MSADDLAVIIADSMDMKFTSRYLHLEKKLQPFFENLVYYSILTVQAINCSRTEAVWSARAIEPSKFEISYADNKTQWVKEFKYSGYWITPKLGFGTLIKKTMLKVRQRVGVINSVWIAGSSSPQLRKVLFLSKRSATVYVTVSTVSNLYR